MQIDIKRTLKDIYAPSRSVTQIEVPVSQYICLSGVGDPNSAEFAQATESLYAVAYALKMLPKKHAVPENWTNFVVAPLEGDWYGDINDRTSWNYTLCISQPSFITQEIFEYAKEIAVHKKPKLRIKEILLKTVPPHKCVTIMHIGPYATEPESFAKMDEFCKMNGLTRISKSHHEIYLSDPRKVDPGKLKTVLRYRVE